MHPLRPLHAGLSAERKGGAQRVGRSETTAVGHGEGDSQRGAFLHLEFRPHRLWRDEIGFGQVGLRRRGRDCRRGASRHQGICAPAQDGRVHQLHHLGLPCRLPNDSGILSESTQIPRSRRFADGGPRQTAEKAASRSPHRLRRALHRQEARSRGMPAHRPCADF